MDLGSNVANGQANGAAAPDLIKESDTAHFQADVLEASQTVPVLVDFWAPWCGPCRALGPAIERVVASLGGKIKLVKINVDENQALSGQMGVQSIPAVFAFSGGQPIDGFMGALPEGEIRKFAQKVIDKAGKGAPADPREAELQRAMDAVGEALEAEDMERAAQILQLILQQEPDYDPALIQYADLLLKNEQTDAAKDLFGRVSAEGQKLDGYAALASALQLAEEAEALGSVADLEARVAADPNDHQARYDLALALNAKGFRAEAVEALIALMRADRSWNEDAARLKLLELFEAWGAKDPATAKGRRLLSAVLFS